MTDLLLLHGALGARTQFDTLHPALRTDYRLHAIDFEGHGSAAATGRPFRIEAFAENVIAYLDSCQLKSCDIFGYSMGGYVALHLAHSMPERVGRVFTLGTKLRWDPETATREVKKLDPDVIRQKVPQFANALEARHSGPGWENVLAKTAEMMIALGESSPLNDNHLRSITQRIRIGVGDRDVTVSVEESAGAYRLLPAGELQVFPATPHPFEKVSMSMIAESIREFMGRDEVSS